MSRTGVGIRVLVDDRQLDDGCLPWSPYPPGTELRRNHARGPIPAAGEWAGYGLSVSGMWASSNTGSTAGVAYVFTTRWDEAIAVGDQVAMGITFLVPSAPAGTAQYVALSAHRRTGNTYLGTRKVIPIQAGVEQTVYLTYTSTVAMPAGDMDLAVFPSDAAGNFFTSPVNYTFRVKNPIFERWVSAPGPFFYGDSPDTAEVDYQWAGQVNLSASLALAPSYPDRLPEGLTADDGLSITWGRSDTVSQPSPSTATFTVLDSTETQYAQSFNIGSTVEILADATITGGATVPAFTDPDFETELRAVTFNATATRDDRHVETGTVAAVMKPINQSSPYRMQLPPGTLQAPGTNPNAWDNLPHLSPGETWHMQARVWVPPNLQVTARLLVYSGPYAADVTVGQVIGSTFGVGDWVTLEADVSPGVQLGWLGVQIEAQGGSTWQDYADTITWASLPTDFEWRDMSDVYVDRVTILAPPGGTRVTQLVFGGRITDMEASWDSDAPSLSITATDFLGDLGNRYVGDEPWLAEPLAVRLQRVLELAQVPGEPSITADIATTFAPVVLTYEDVDHRAASGLLADMANSVDGVLWSATHLVSGPYVRLEDPAQRPALYQLGKPDFWIEILPIDPSTLPESLRPLDISACDVLRDPVQWVLDVSDIATRATVTWVEQTVDEEGQPDPTERTLAHIDPAAEAQFGTRNISVQTMLTTAPEAQTVAERLLARNAGEWRLSGLAVADRDFQVPDQVAVNILLSLLDGVRRGGMAIRVVDLPLWSPLGASVPAYVEGGTYTFTEGGWQLELTVSRGTGLGRNAQWDQLDPTWTWDDWNPGITWDDLRGVAAPGMT